MSLPMVEFRCRLVITVQRREGWVRLLPEPSRGDEGGPIALRTWSWKYRPDSTGCYTKAQIL